MARDELLIVSNSELGVFRECRQKWDWAMNDRLVPRGAQRALRFGDLVHQALALYYPPGKKRGPHPAESFVEIYRAQLEGQGKLNMMGDEGWLDAEELGVAMLENYVDHYGPETDRWEVVAPEMPCVVDIKDHRGRYLFTYVCKPDAVIRDLRNGKLGLFEHKTSGSAEKPGTPLSLDEQTGNYFTFAPHFLHYNKSLRKGEDLDFILFNILRKARPDQRPRDDKGRYLNQDGSVSKKQPPAYFNREPVYRTPENRSNSMARVKAIVREMQQVRNGDLAVYKNPAEHCKWCPFKDMCEVHENGSDWEVIRDSEYTVGDPYSRYEWMEELDL